MATACDQSERESRWGTKSSTCDTWSQSGLCPRLDAVRTELPLRGCYHLIAGANFALLKRRAVSRYHLPSQLGATSWGSKRSFLLDCLSLCDFIDCVRGQLFKLLVKPARPSDLNFLHSDLFSESEMQAAVTC